MRIKLKVKTLLLFSVGFLILLFFVIPTGTVVMARMLDRMDSPYAGAFYERYLNQTFGNRSLGARVEYADSLVNNFYRYAIFAGMSGGRTDNHPEDLEKAKELLIEGLEREKSLENQEKSYARAYHLLMDLFITTGDMEGFIHWLNIDTGESKELQELNLVYEAYNELYFGDLNRAKQLLEDEIDSDHYLYEQQILQGEIALREGDMNRAEDYFRWNYDFNIRAYGGHGAVFGTGSLTDQDTWLNTYKQDLVGDFTLSGRVIFEGEPMSFVEIYVKGAGDTGWHTSGERFVAITDKDGYFQSIGLRRGSYDVGVGIDTSRMYDKYYVQGQGHLAEGQFILEEDEYLELEFTKPVEFGESKKNYNVREEEELQLSWEPVEGAKYYEVEILTFSNPTEMTGSHGPQPLMNIEGAKRFENNQETFSITSINQSGTGGMVTFTDEEMLIGPTAVLRPILPGTTYPLIINAFDEEGRKITSSLTLIGTYTDVPSFTLEGELTKGEKLIIDQNYPEAISYYNEHIEDEKVREEALRTLSLLYHYGWKRGEEDQVQALSFAKEYYNETGNSRHLEMIIGSISLEELVKNRSMVENSMEMIEEPEDPYYFQQARANLHLIDEEWEQAVMRFEENEQSLSWKVLYLDLVLGDYQSAAKRLRDSRFHVYRMEPLRTEEALQALSEEGLSFADETRLVKLMEALLIESRDSAEEVYREILPDVESKALRDLLYEIHLNNNWDRDW